jgi:hypothetical protein
MTIIDLGSGRPDWANSPTGQLFTAGKYFNLKSNPNTGMQLRSRRPLHLQGDASHPGNSVVDKKRIIGEN